MADVIFDEDPDLLRRSAPASTKGSSIVKIVYKSGLAKTPQGADVVMIIVVLLCIVLSLFFLSLAGIITL